MSEAFQKVNLETVRLILGKSRDHPKFFPAANQSKMSIGNPFSGVFCTKFSMYDEMGSAFSAHLTRMTDSKVTLDGGSKQCGAQQVNLRDQLGPILALNQSLGPKLPCIRQPESP